MGNSQSIVKINYEYVQNEIKYKRSIIINTLPIANQKCLIHGTISAVNEEEILNRYLKTNRSIQIIIYGMNSCDESIAKKYNQLVKLGFLNIFIYVGGLFEWLLLQEIYGEELFPTTTYCKDRFNTKRSW